MGVMHLDETVIDDVLVATLLEAQFPEMHSFGLVMTW